MRVLFTALALLASVALAVPAEAQVPDLPPIPPLPPVNQCVGSTTVVHACAVFGHQVPKQGDPVPPTIDPPAAPACIQGDPMVIGFILDCTGSVTINGRANTYRVSLYRGFASPALPALPPL